jgi:hypothetical protein
MRTHDSPNSFLFAVSFALLTSALSACADRQLSTRSDAAPPSSLQDRIAKELAAASPMADPSDMHARDLAGDNLSRIADLQRAIGEQILWGGYDEKLGFDIPQYKITAFNGFVWAKLYLSTYMFPGPYEIQKEGARTILEVRAKFRDGLDPGDYPYPFWHSPKKWQGYLDTQAVIFLFEGDHLIAGFRKAIHDPAEPLAQKPWDGRWHWENAAGQAEPRVSLYTYLLSPQNPHGASLDQAYRELEGRFRAHECLTCHSPDNVARSAKLFMLNYPNQALAGRHELMTVLAKDAMPPLDADTGRSAGLHDEDARQELLRLARKFEAEGDAALEYEHAHASPSDTAAPTR